MISFFFLGYDALLRSLFYLFEACIAYASNALWNSSTSVVDRLFIHPVVFGFDLKIASIWFSGMIL
jgi:hypothetical protein